MCQNLRQCADKAVKHAKRNFYEIGHMCQCSTFFMVLGFQTNKLKRFSFRPNIQNNNIQHYGLLAALSINDIQHNVFMLSVVMLSVLITLMLY